MKITNEVILGRDGYLFLAGGGHRVFEYISGSIEVPALSIEVFNKNIELREKICADKNIQFIHTISPDKHSVLSNKFPSRYIKSIGLMFSNSIGASKNLFIPNEKLKILSKKYQIFKRTDTHLSDLGSLFYAGMLVEQLTKISQVELIEKYLSGTLPRAINSSGDLGSKITPQIFSEELVYPDPPINSGKWFHNNLSGGNNGIVDLRFNPDAPFKSRVILFGDSFGRALSKWLQLWFSEIIFLRTPNFHAEIVDAYCPNIVISQNVERYLPSTLSDIDAIDFFSYPNLIDEAYKPSEDFKHQLNLMRKI